MTNPACAAIFQKYRLAIRMLALTFAIAIGAFLPSSPAAAACTVPNQITNGQPADATVVMGNFNALKDCADAGVTPSGTPTAGNITVFSGPKSITSGDLSGDCTTAGGLSVTCTKTNGTALSYFATGTDAAQLTGTISVNRFDSGINADASHFLRGDGVWAVPSSSGGSANPWWWAPPNTADFTLISGDAVQPTFANDADIGPVLAFNSAAVAGDIIRAAVETIPTPPAAWTYEVRMSGSLYLGNYGGVGLLIRNVENNRNLHLALQNDGSINIQRRSMAGYNSTVLTLAAPNQGNFAGFANLFFKVTYDGAGNLKFYTSSNGKQWRFLVTESVSTYLIAAPNRIGFGIYTSNAGDNTSDIALAVQRRSRSW